MQRRRSRLFDKKVNERDASHSSETWASRTKSTTILIRGSASRSKSENTRLRSLLSDPSEERVVSNNMDSSTISRIQHANTSPRHIIQKRVIKVFATLTIYVIFVVQSAFALRPVGNTVTDNKHASVQKKRDHANTFLVSPAQEESEAFLIKPQESPGQMKNPFLHQEQESVQQLNPEEKPSHAPPRGRGKTFLQIFLKEKRGTENKDCCSPSKMIKMWRRRKRDEADEVTERMLKKCLDTPVAKLPGEDENSADYKSRVEERAKLKRDIEDDFESIDRREMGVHWFIVFEKVVEANYPTKQDTAFHECVAQTPELRSRLNRHVLVDIFYMEKILQDDEKRGSFVIPNFTIIAKIKKENKSQVENAITSDPLASCAEEELCNHPLENIDFEGTRARSGLDTFGLDAPPQLVLSATVDNSKQIIFKIPNGAFFDDSNASLIQEFCTQSLLREMANKFNKKSANKEFKDTVQISDPALVDFSQMRKRTPQVLRKHRHDVLLLALVELKLEDYKESGESYEYLKERPQHPVSEFQEYVRKKKCKISSFDTRGHFSSKPPVLSNSEIYSLPPKPNNIRDTVIGGERVACRKSKLTKCVKRIEKRLDKLVKDRLEAAEEQRGG